MIILCFRQWHLLPCPLVYIWSDFTEHIPPVSSYRVHFVWLQNLQAESKKEGGELRIQLTCFEIIPLFLETYPAFKYTPKFLSPQFLCFVF